ncbi:hypothetical protein GDO81_008004 [Engystomops pustulosus]|uniref:Uncharacterized protein n=1 Tax=Engystomops pustulosus TaxID=76066 RepID=A0AAV7CBC6_ENGPU|nr:hypothetical protein GDO81_008004 [Engystomops pustulosus]
MGDKINDCLLVTTPHQETVVELQYNIMLEEKMSVLSKINLSSQRSIYKFAKVGEKHVPIEHPIFCRKKTLSKMSHIIHDMLLLSCI